MKGTMMHKYSYGLATVSLLSALCLFETSTALSAPKKSNNAAKPQKTEVAEAPASPPPPAAAMQEGRQMFATLCSTCHGASGRGDGAAAAALTPKPRDFSAVDWQKQTSDDVIAKIIVEGGMALGKSPVMPANPQLKDKPEVVAALRFIIREFGKK